MSENKHLEKYRLIVSGLLIAILLVFNLGIRVGISWTGNSNSISPGFVEGFKGNFTDIFLNDVDKSDILEYPEATASYIIFKSGSTYYAKNGSTGQVTSNSDAATLINSILGNGTWVHIKSGVYWFSGSIDLTGLFNVIISGESKVAYTNAEYGTILRLAFGSNNTLIVKNETSATIAPTLIEHLHLRGGRGYGDTQGSGIYLNNVKRFVVRDVYFSHIGSEYGIELGSNYIEACYIYNNEFTSCGIYSAGSALTNYIHDNIFATNSKNAIDFSSSVVSVGNRIINNEMYSVGGASYGIVFRQLKESNIEGNSIYDFSSQGIRLLDEIQRVDISKNHIWNIPQGILIRGLSNQHSFGNNIHDNTFEDMTTGVHLYQYQYNTTVHHNHYQNVTTPFTKTAPTSDIKIHHNQGYVTENRGTQTCADNENIVHGLAGIPTYAEITPLNDTYDSVPIIATIDWSNVDSTNIQVGLYWINGTAISDNVILVAWKAEYEP